MEKEVDPQVLAVIDEKRLSGPRLTPVEIVAKMGVFDARDKPYEYAWLATGDNVIATIWAENVHVGAGGRWFYLESLDIQRRPGGGARAPNQIQRAKDRLALLKKTFDGGTGFRAVLQTNRVAIVELESNKSAKVSTRVRDDDEWHVAQWDAEAQRAVLVRGPRGWVPSETELRDAAAKGQVAPAAEEAEPEVVVNASAEEIQAAAMAYVTRHFTGYGYKADVVTDRGLGYDIDVSNSKGAALLKVTVKGVTPGAPKFKLSGEQRAASVSEPLWRLLVVSDATSAAPQHKIYKSSEMNQVADID